MENKIDLFEIALIALTAVTFIVPGFQSIDQMFPEFLYLSVIQGLTTFYIFFFKKDGFIYHMKNMSVVSSIIFLVFSIFSYFNATNKQLVFIEFIYFSLFFITLFNSIILLHKKSFNFYINLILILLTLESSKVLLEFSKIYDFSNPVLRSQYYAGFSSNVNITSFSIIFKIPIIFYVLFKLEQKNNFLKFSLYGLLFTSVFAIFLCYSRGAIITLFIISLLYLIILIKSKSQIRNIFYFLSTILLVYGSNKLAFLNSDSDVLKRASTFDIESQDSSFNYRLGYYNDAINGFIQKPIFGWGLGNWKIVGISFARERMKEYEVGYHTHNDFLQLFAEIGAIGGISYIMIIFYPIILLFRRINKLSIENKYFFSFLALMFLIFFLDSNINFPRARPTSIINISLLVAVTYSQIKIRFNE